MTQRERDQIAALKTERDNIQARLDAVVTDAALKAEKLERIRQIIEYVGPYAPAGSHHNISRDAVRRVLDDKGDDQ